MVLRKELQVDLSKVRREIQAIARDIERAFTLTSGKVDLGLDQLSQEARTAEQELARLTREAEELAATDISLQATVEVSGVAEAEASIERLDGTTANVGFEADTSSLDEAQTELAETAEAADALTEAAGEVSAGFGDLLTGASGLQVAFQGLGPVVGAVVGGFAALVAIGEQVQNATNDIQIATGATGAALDGLVDSALAIQEEVPASLATAADSVGILNTFLGVTGPELEGLSTALIDVSRLLGEDASSNAQNFAQTLNLFGTPARDGVETLDLLFAATQKYGVGLGELLSTLETSGGIFQAVGLDLEQSTTLIGQFNLAGLGAGEATAALTQLIARAEESGQSFNATLIDLQTSIQGAATDQEAFAIGIDNFGTRSGVAFSQAIRQGIIDLESLSGQLGDTGGLIAKTAEDTETTGQSLRETFNELLVAISPVAEALSDVLLVGVQELGAEISDALADVDLEELADNIRDEAIPAIREFAGDIGSLVEKIDEAASAAERLYRAAQIVTDPVGAAKGVFDGFVDSLNGTEKAIGEVDTASKEARSALLGAVAAADAERIGRAQAGFASFAQSLRDAEAAAEGVDSGAARLQRRLADIEFGQIDFQPILDEQAEAAYLARVAALTPQVEGLFGDPFGPAIDDETFTAYLARVAELQTATAEYQLNLLRLEEELSEEDFDALLDTFAEVGEEGSARFAEELVEALGTAEFDGLIGKLRGTVDAAALGEKVTAAIASAAAGEVEVALEVDRSELDLLGNQIIPLDVLANLDTAQIEAFIEEELGIDIVLNPDDSLLEAELSQQRFVDVVLSTSNEQDFFDNLQTFFDNNPITLNDVIIGGIAGGGGAEWGGYWNVSGVRQFERGGAIAWNPGAGVPFVMPGGGIGIYGESHRGPELLERGPNGMAIVGAYHDDDLTDRRLLGTGIDATEFPRIQRLVTATARGADSMLAGQLGALRSELAEANRQLADMKRDMARAADASVRHLPRVVEETAATVDAVGDLSAKRERPTPLERRR